MKIYEVGSGQQYQEGIEAIALILFDLNQNRSP